MKQRNAIYTLITLLGWSNAQESRSFIRNGALSSNNHKSNTSNRNLQTAIQGSCQSSTLSPGDLIKANESILCYPSGSNKPIYKFGIDSTNNLAYYVYDTLIWRAVPTVEESTACIVFGNCDSPSMVFFRLQNGGSLVGYDGNTAKIWDSHENIEENGEYIDGGVFNGDDTDATGEKVSGSTLYLNEEGVFIESPGEAVTWRLFAPDWEAPSVSPVDAPSLSPVVVTAEPTKKPTPSPVVSTMNPTTNPTPSPVETQSDFVGVSGRVFQDETDSSSIVSNIVVDLYDCPDSGDPTWIVMTRTNQTGYYVLKDDDNTSGGNDLSALLARTNTAKFRAMFGGLPSGYMFSPAVSGSDVNSDGMTACWDLDENGRGSIVWNAGVIAIDDSTDAPISQPTTARPTVKPTSEPTVSIGLVGGYAFLDADDNGIRYPNTSVEPAMTNIDVELFSCGSTASNFNDDTKLAVDKTNAEGMYIFRNLTSGYYRINVLAPEGYIFSSIWTGNQENGTDVDSTVDPDSGSTPCFRVIQGNTDLSRGFGLTNDGSSSPAATPSTLSPEETTSSPVVGATENATIVISGLVFYDKDENGYFDEVGEETISGVDVALFNCDGAIIFVGSTDENGYYGFNNLKQGSYQVKFSPPTGYAFSNVWSGAVDEEGKLVTTDASSDVDPDTGLSPCKPYANSIYSLNAGMILSSVGTIPTGNPTNDAKGDGTPCSGGKCQEEGMCRNVAGVCGSGLSFCNPQSVWTPDCAEETIKNPTLSPISVTPTISTQPSASSAPSQNPSVYKVSVCNKDGSYGETKLHTNADGEGIREHGVSFTYSLLNESNQSFEDAVAQFEQELNSRLACIYFDDPCLDCSGQRRLTRSRRLVVEGSDVVGLSSEPKDEQDLGQACAFPNYNCRVMYGYMTSYFPAGTSLPKVISDTNQLLNIISDEMATNDWNGVTVSYDNKPTESSGAKEVEGESGSEGFPAGAIVGIVLATVAALAASIALVVFFIKDRREKEHLQSMVIPYGDDSRRSQSFSDDDNSDSDSSSSEGDMSSGVISGPSLVSGGDYSFPTTMARANPSDVELDDSSSSSDSSSGSDVESGEYDIEEHEASVENLKTSASSDEAPPIYERDEDYSQERPYSGQYQKQLDEQNGDFYHDDPMQYGQISGGDDTGSNRSDGSMGSINSADPPGRSFRDLHQDDGWNNIMPHPQSMAPNNVIEGGFYEDEGPHDVYENDDLSRSSRSTRSHRSNRSRNSRDRSKSRGRSKSRDRNQASYHSFYNDENDYIGDVDQGSYEGQNYNEQNFNVPQFDDGVVPQYDQQFKDQNDQHYNQDFHGYPQYQGQGAEYGDDTTTYSDATRQMSNVQTPMHQVEQLSETNSEPSYEDQEEESISNIFKSLSEIQTKLAKKGKITSRGKSSASSQSSDGLVEDVSVDGSQVSSFEQRAAKNRRPSAGNWMEPVEEDES